VTRRRSQARGAFAVGALAGVLGCGGAAVTGAGTHATAANPANPAFDDALADVARIHGEAGPWAVAGYRMGRYALAKLGLERQSFDLEVIHYAPHDVMYSCVADGASAATGASVGKLNLRMVDADVSAFATVYRSKASGRTLALRPTRAFAARFGDIPRERLREAGQEVLLLPEADVFEEVTLP
jgi:formylmethanofuran dehydrogenase subunit E